MASFCTGRAGHYDMVNQAISDFLPNMTWLQPPGHVHAMIHRSWQPNALNATLDIPPMSNWSSIPDKELKCSGHRGEYHGELGTPDSAEGCLQLLLEKATGLENYAV